MDGLDQRIAAGLQVNGRVGWNHVARVVGVSETTVARRAQRMIADGTVRVVVIADPVRCGFGFWVLVQLKCEVGEGARVAHALADRGDVRYVALVTGVFDIVAELIVPSRQYLAELLLEGLPGIGGIRETVTRTVLRNFKMSYDWTRDLLGEAAEDLERFSATGGGENRVLDEVDLKLYELLLEDGRRSYSELAALSGVSEYMARRRVESLWEEGCIKFATLVDPALFGYEVECICLVNVELSKLEETAKAVAGNSQVRYVSATIDSSDLICEIVMRSQDELYEFCTGTLGGLSGVQKVEVYPKLRTIKQAYVRLSAAEDSGASRIYGLKGERGERA